MRHLQRFIRTALVTIALLTAVSAASAQALSNATLNGKFFFRHLMLFADATGATSASAAYGIVTFDGGGNCALQGQQIVGSGSGINIGINNCAYHVDPNGFVTITNPQRTNFTLNARVGVNAIVGSTTEVTGGLNDLFIAIPAPRVAVSNSSLFGNYQVATIEVPFGLTPQVRNTLFTWNASGQGTFSPITVTGHAANLGQQVITQTVTGANYAISSDGSGTANFPLPSGATQNGVLLGSNKILYVSADGNIIIGGSPNPGGEDLIIATRAPSAAVSNASLRGIYFTAGLTVQTQGLGSFAGSANSTGSGKMLFTRRVHSATGTVDVTGVSTYTVNSDGSGTSDLSRLAVGTGGSVFLTSALNNSDPGTFEIDLGVAAPALAGSAVFVNPMGIVNGASFAPAGEPLAPGEIFSVFGTGLAPQAASAGTLPLPTQISGVQVSVNNIPAPLIAISDTQVSAVVPAGVAPGTATIVVTNNTKSSTAIQASIAATAPGIFSVDSSGTGPGAVLHSDFSLVTTAQPAKRGETIQIYLTGLGITSPPVGDGLAAPSSPLSFVKADVTVFIGTTSVRPSFAGLAPGFAGLYQVNVPIPLNAPTGAHVLLGISTTDAFHQQVDVAIQ